LPVTAEARVVDVDGEDAHGSGIVRVGGATWLVKGVLHGERVVVRPTHFHRGVVRAELVDVVHASPQRAAVACPAFARCGGCSWQHLDVGTQIARRSAQVATLLAAAGVRPGRVLEPVSGPALGYRRRGRLGVRHVVSGARTFVGFRETASNKVCAIDACPMLEPRLGNAIASLRAMLSTLSIAHAVPQVEVAAGDDGAALVLRHLLPPSQRDRRQLAAYAADQGFMLLLQAGAPDSATPLWPRDAAPGVPAEPPRLHYALAAHGVDLAFHPLDFVQVNAGINARLVDAVVEALAPDAGDRVVDLFCGIGNLSLPIARRAGAVTGIDFAPELVARAAENAVRNGIANARFLARDLVRDAAGVRALEASAVVVDPPRSGAADVLPHVVALAPSRIAYVSCNPDSLAHDAAALSASGYRLERLQVFDMFPHTAHVESLALFVR
jgi:23S rRNA (uracil1939-C5)-methyltransferase